jgi:hypothetical protein
MENGSRYILRRGDGGLWCFYWENRRVLLRAYEGNKWQKPLAAAEDAQNHFTVALDAAGAVYLLAQGANGDILLCTDQGGPWHSRVILQNRSPKIHQMHMQPILTPEGLCLLYNVPGPEPDAPDRLPGRGVLNPGVRVWNDPPRGEKSEYLLLQTLAGGQWSAPTRLDKCAPTAGFIFDLQMTGPNHGLLFYQTRTPETNLGYREITPHRQGHFQIFHTAGSVPADHSFLTVSDGVHALYVIRSVFSCQLLYRKKDSDQFSSPLLLWEAQRIESCLLFFVRDTLHAVFCSNGALYECLSDNRGETFGRPARYRNKCCYSPVKARYVSALPQTENQFFCRHLYVDGEAPWDIQLLPDLYEDFLPLG